MGQIQPSDYPFIEIGEGLKFSDDPPEGSIGIKPFLDMVNRAQRIMAGIHLGATSFGRHLATNKLVGADQPSFVSPYGLLDAFKDGETRPLGLIGELVGETFTGLPEEATIAYEEFPADERYDKSSFAGFFPGLQKRTWHAHPYVYGVTYDDPTQKETQTFACFETGQPLWHAPFAAMKADLDEIMAVEIGAPYGMDAESGFPYGNEIGFYAGETYLGETIFAEKTDDLYYWDGTKWDKYGDGTSYKADNYNGKIDWRTWTNPLETVTGRVTLGDIFDAGVLMVLITERCTGILQPDGTTIDTETHKCKIMPFAPLEQSRGWGLYESLVSEFGNITMPPKPTLSPSQAGARWDPHATVGMYLGTCLLKIRED